jgi:hypothetical protein
MPTLTRAIVGIPPGIEDAFRQRMEKEYGDRIPEVSHAPLGLLMRFLVLIESGIPEEKARRGLRGLSRGEHRKEAFLTE